MSTIKQRFVRLCSVFLAAALCFAMAAPCIPGASADYLEGDWEKISLSDGDNSYNVHAFQFDHTITNCTSFKLELDVSMKANTHCENWQIWLGRNGSFSKAGTIYLPGGDGSTTKTIKLSEAKTFDAIAVTPTVPGGYSWSLWLGVSDVVTMGSSDSSSSSRSSGSSITTYEDVMSGDWEKVKIDSASVYAFVFDNSIRRCTQLTVDIDVSMKYNAHCYTWQVWYRSNGSFSKLGTIPLPGGDGEASKTFYLKSPITFDAIAVTPVASGSFSWSMGLLVYDVECQ